MAKVKGVYTFKDTLTPITFGSQDVNFVSNAMGTERTYVRIKDDAETFSSGTALAYVYSEYNIVLEADDYIPVQTYFFDNNYGMPTGWYYETAKTVDFGEAEQTVSDVFYAWLMENTISKKTVKGVWIFKDTLTPATFERQDVSFATTLNFTEGEKEKSYSCIQATTAPNNSSISAIAYVSYDNSTGEKLENHLVYLYPHNAALPEYWRWTSAKTIDFGETEQEVSDEFYAWIMENVALVVDYPQITIMENSTTTLATAGKYCDRNIEINVNVPT